MLDICLTLQLSKELIGCIPDLQAGESEATHLMVMIPSELHGFNHRVEFIKPNREKFCSGLLEETEDGHGKYKVSIDLENGLLNLPGEYTLQYVGTNGNVKFPSRPITFKVRESVSATEEIVKQPDIVEDLLNRINKNTANISTEVKRATKEEQALNKALEAETNRATKAEEQLNNNKVDKVEGKGLSANDYTNEEKEFLKIIMEESPRVDYGLVDEMILDE